MNTFLGMKRSIILIPITEIYLSSLTCHESNIKKLEFPTSTPANTQHSLMFLEMMAHLKPLNDTWPPLAASSSQNQAMSYCSTTEKNL